MGYTTEFEGSFNVSPAAPESLVKYVNAFMKTRHMRRNVDAIKEAYPDWKEYTFNGELGPEGEFFTQNDYAIVSYKDDNTIIDVNQTPKSQPSLWCDWELSEDGTELHWNGMEKFYGYTEWLQYLIDNFFQPSGCTLNGEVEYQGEASEDQGQIIVENNNIFLKKCY